MFRLLLIKKCRERLCHLDIDHATEQRGTVQIFHGTFCLFVGTEVGKARVASFASLGHGDRTDSANAITVEEVCLRDKISISSIPRTAYHETRTTSLFFVLVATL